MSRMLIREEGLLCGKWPTSAPDVCVKCELKTTRLPANRGQLWDGHGCSGEHGQGAEGGSALCGHPARLHPQLHVRITSNNKTMHLSSSDSTLTVTAPMSTRRTKYSV